jgi:hypothetical protein
MILYTMMPHDQIFPPSGEETGNQVMITYNGIPVMAEWAENHEYRVIRVMSTDPNHYMDPSCMPGSKISLS